MRRSPEAADPDIDLWFHTNATDANSEDNRRLLLHSKPIKDLNENQWIVGSVWFYLEAQ